jgi:hypothetical protein
MHTAEDNPYALTPSFGTPRGVWRALASLLAGSASGRRSSGRRGAVVYSAPFATARARTKLARKKHAAACLKQQRLRESHGRHG